MDIDANKWGVENKKDKNNSWEITEDRDEFGTWSSDDNCYFDSVGSTLIMVIKEGRQCIKLGEDIYNGKWGFIWNMLGSCVYTLELRQSGRVQTLVIVNSITWRRMEPWPFLRLNYFIRWARLFMPLFTATRQDLTQGYMRIWVRCWRKWTIKITGDRITMEMR